MQSGHTGSLNRPIQSEKALELSANNKAHGLSLLLSSTADQFSTFPQSVLNELWLRENISIISVPTLLELSLYSPRCLLKKNLPRILEHG